MVVFAITVAMILRNFISLQAFTVYMKNSLRFEICTEVTSTSPELVRMLIIKLPYTKVKFYHEVKSQTGLSSLRVSCKRALTPFSTKFKRANVFWSQWRQFQRERERKREERGLRRKVWQRGILFNDSTINFLIISCKLEIKSKNLKYFFRYQSHSSHSHCFPSFWKK